MLTHLLNSVADAGRELLGLGARPPRPAHRAAADLCRDLMSSKGEAHGTALAREIVDVYATMGQAEKLAFFRMVDADFAARPEVILSRAAAYREAPGLESFLALNAAVEPPRQELFRRINMAPNGTAAIVAMRSDLLGLLADHPELKAVDVDLRHLLSSWFNRGFLYLERIDWRTPAAILEKLMIYEAVHRMEGWDDLRRRLAEDRRCFAFFHPALRDEPLIFVEVALLKGMAGAIRPLLDRAGTPAPPAGADTAVFYSISNCQEGLRGISFGNFLIKQVVVELSRELPNLKVFATLSPIPGFRRWLDTALQEEGAAGEAERAALAHLDQTAEWETDPAACEALRAPLLRLCARYLVAGGREGRPCDPVARFHLGNGARLERLNWMADRSARGLAQSAGLMVNYLYDLGTIERNHEAYVNEGKVIAAPAVARLARAKPA